MLFSYFMCYILWNFNPCIKYGMIISVPIIHSGSTLDFSISPHPSSRPLLFHLLITEWVQSVLSMTHRWSLSLVHKKHADNFQRKLIIFSSSAVNANRFSACYGSSGVSLHSCNSFKNGVNRRDMHQGVCVCVILRGQLSEFSSCILSSGSKLWNWCCLVSQETHLPAQLPEKLWQNWMNSMAFLKLFSLLSHCAFLFHVFAYVSWI